MSSDLFSIYEDKFNEILNQLSKITSSFLTLSREKAESAITGGNSLMKEGDNILKQLEIESTSNTQNNDMLIIKTKNYKNEFQALKEKFLTLQNNYISKKEENALSLGIEEDNIQHQKAELIDNEVNHEKIHNTRNNSSIGEGKVEIITNEMDIKNSMHNTEVNTYQYDSDFKFKLKTKRKKILMITTIIIIILLMIVISIILLFSLRKKDK